MPLGDSQPPGVNSSISHVSAFYFLKTVALNTLYYSTHAGGQLRRATVYRRPRSLFSDNSKIVDFYDGSHGLPDYLLRSSEVMLSIDVKKVDVHVFRSLCYSSTHHGRRAPGRQRSSSNCSPHTSTRDRYNFIRALFSFVFFRYASPPSTAGSRRHIASSLSRCSPILYSSPMCDTPMPHCLIEAPLLPTVCTGKHALSERSVQNHHYIGSLAACFNHSRTLPMKCNWLRLCTVPIRLLLHMWTLQPTTHSTCTIISFMQVLRRSPMVEHYSATINNRIINSLRLDRR